MKIAVLVALLIASFPAFAFDPIEADIRGEYYRRNGLSMMPYTPPPKTQTITRKFEVSRVGSAVPGFNTRETLIDLFEVIKLTSKKELTKEEFIKELKAGKSFEVRTIESVPCSARCYRGKRKGDVNKGELADKEYTCETCGGKGTQEAQVIWTIVW